MIIQKSSGLSIENIFDNEESKCSLTVPIRTRYRLTNDLFYNDCGDKCEQQTYISCLNVFKIVLKAVVLKNSSVSIFFDILDKFQSLPSEQIMEKLQIKGDENSLTLAQEIEQFQRYAVKFNKAFLESPDPPKIYNFNKEMEGHLLDLVQNEFEQHSTPAMISIRGWNGKEFKIIQASFNKALIEHTLGWTLDQYLTKCAVSNQPEMIPKQEYLKFNRFLMKSCFNDRDDPQIQLQLSLLNKNYERIPMKMIKKESRYENKSLIVSVILIEEQSKDELMSNQSKRSDSSPIMDESIEIQQPECECHHILKPNQSRFLYGHYPQLRNVILMYQNKRCGYRQINTDKEEV